MRMIIKTFLVFSATMFLVACGTPYATVQNRIGDPVMLLGYDPVAYFTEGKPVKGSEEFSYDWLGTPWHFANREHRELFKSEPVKYAPQFGGYCAGEVAGDGITINIDPEAWRIIDGKLYLLYQKGGAAYLEAHPEDWLPKAEANWPKLETKLNEGKYY